MRHQRRHHAIASAADDDRHKYATRWEVYPSEAASREAARRDEGGNRREGGTGEKSDGGDDGGGGADGGGTERPLPHPAA